jgi:hypothetical protein
MLMPPKRLGCPQHANSSKGRTDGCENCAINARFRRWQEPLAPMNCRSRSRITWPRPEKQVTRLEQVFRTLGETARGKSCDRIRGTSKKASVRARCSTPRSSLALRRSNTTRSRHTAQSRTLGNCLAKTRPKSFSDRPRGGKAANDKRTQITKSRVNRRALLNPADEQSSPSPRRARGRSSRISKKR